MGNKFIYKIGFSEDINIENRLNSYFYMNPGSEIISLRRGDELLEDLIHYYLYYLGYRYQKNNKLDEWFTGDPEVLNIFHISRESLERKLWKYRDKVFNIDKIKSDRTLDLQLFRYLYTKNKDSFVGERYRVTENKELIKLNPKEIDLVFYNSLLKYFPEEIIVPSPSNISEYQSDLEREVQDFLDNKFYSTGIFKYKMRMYCEFMDKHQGNKEVSDIIYFKIKDPRYRNFYNFYGTKGCKAVSYEEKKLEIGMIDTTSDSVLYTTIYTRFKCGERYTSKDLKEILREIYQDLGISRTPKANDLRQYFKLIKTKITLPDKTLKDGFRLDPLEG